jgi:N6-adenosine-specific RNA methylase IME4
LALIRDGTINPTASFADINKEIRLKRIANDRARIARLRPIDGKFGTLVVDPPWANDWLSEGAQSRLGYATMSINELVQLKVAQWAARTCHLYLWTTNNFMPVACNLVRAWGFQHRSVLTWLKTDSNGRPRIGRGHYFRNTTEHVLFATRGETSTSKRSMTHFSAPVGKHSEKPDAFYDIVRRESPLPAGEVFGGKQRADFVNVYVEHKRERASK